MINIHRCH